MKWDASDRGWSDLPIQIRLVPQSVKGISPRRSAIPGNVALALRKCCMGESPWPALLVGPAGTGKTYAAVYLARKMRAVYRSVPEMLEELIRANGQNMEKSPNADVVHTWHWWDCWRAVELAVLDEIGSRERVSDFHYKCVKRAIDAREGYPAIYITNLGLNNIAKIYDDRIASRLSGGTVIHVAGKDRRLER